MIIHYMCSPE